MNEISRRNFISSAGTAVISLLFWPASGRALSSLIVNGVDSLKAYADGKSDATSAIQALIDSLPSEGGTVEIPEGKYQINVEKGILLRSGVHLVLLPRAMLIAAPTRLGQYSIIKIYSSNGVSVTGGSLIGERQGHLGRGGEWGFGIDVRASSNVLLSNIVVSDCWGDGFYIGALNVKGIRKGCENITLNNVAATENRRQGLSIVACNGAHIINSKFSDTHGAPPASGIDLEPNNIDEVSNVVIDNCDVRNNAGCGIQTWNASSNVKVSNCRIEGNGSRGIYLGGLADGVMLSKNQVLDNGGVDIYVGNKVRALSLKENIVTTSKAENALDKGRIYYEKK